MQQACTPRRQRWLDWSKEDEDVMACQVISAFCWILLVLLMNFFLLHRSNTIPAAEAKWTEPEPALRPPEIPVPLPQLAMLPDRVTWEFQREFLEDDYKPVYYFLYKDQIRFVDRVPPPEVVVASLKTVVPSPVVPEKKEVVKKEPERPPPEAKPIRLDWIDMTLVEQAQAEPQRPEVVKEPSKTKAPQTTVRLAMVKNLDLDLQIAKDTPTPLVPREPEQAPRQALPQMRASVLDMDMEIMEQPTPEKPPRVIAPAAQRKQPVMRTPSGADHVHLPMEIAPQSSSFRATAQVSNQPARKGTAHRTLIAQGRAGPAVDVPMSLDIGKKTAGVSRIGSQGTIDKETRAARFVAVTGKGVGGIELPVGILEGEGYGKGSQGRPESTPPPSAHKTPVRVTLQTSVGSIRLGTSLAFALADVGSETHTGNAYVRKSAHLKRLLDQQALPEAPVTVSTEDAAEDRKGSNPLIAVSYSREQVVLQYANGKQHVVSLVQGEPYPRFEMRRSSDGSGTVPVGTKLEEITACLSTLQQILKE